MTLIPTTQVHVSPDDYKRKIAYALMQQGMDTSPVQAWTQGLARLAQGAMGGYDMYRDEQKLKQDEADKDAAYLKFLQPQGAAIGAPQSAPSAGPVAALAKPVQMASTEPMAPVIPPRQPVEEIPGIVRQNPDGKIAGNITSPTLPNPQVAQALGPIAPTPVKTESVTPTPTPTEPQMADAKARIAQLLQSPNRAERLLGRSLAEKSIADEATPKFKFQTAGDTLYRTSETKGTAEPIRDVGRGVKPMTEEERRLWKVPEGVAAGIDDNGKPVFSQPSNINTVSPVVTGINERFDAGLKAAQGAPQSIASIHETRRALDSGAITGANADKKLYLAKIGTMFGLPDDKVTNTEVARAAVGNQVLESAKTLGANPSDADRKYIQQVKGGEIELNEKSMRELLDMQERWARKGIKQSNAMAEKLIATDPEKLGRFKPMLMVDEPASYEDYVKTNPVKSAAPDVNALKKKYGLQ